MCDFNNHQLQLFENKEISWCNRFRYLGFIIQMHGYIYEELLESNLYGWNGEIPQEYIMKTYEKFNNAIIGLVLY